MLRLWGNAGFLAKHLASKDAHSNTFEGNLHRNQPREGVAATFTYTTRAGRGRARPLTTARTRLMSDEVGKKVCQNAEKRQSRDSVCRQNPCSAAFMMAVVRCRGLLNLGRNFRGPIFHTRKTSERKDRGARTLCVTPARRHGRQDYLARILLRFCAPQTTKFAAIPGAPVGPLPRFL